MGVSFKIGKAGKRFRQKVVLSEENETENDAPTTSNHSQEEVETTQGDVAEVGDRGAHHSTAFTKSGSLLVSEDHDVSFSLNLFPNGFTVGKANELLHDVPKNLCPYDRQAESIFCAIENGCIPGDLFDDIPCKYINGAIICEIQDYRDTSFKEGDNPSFEKSPKIEKVVLRMGMENVIKDIASVADDSWTYSNLLEMEARVLKALRPVLQLSPKPILDGFPEIFPSPKLNLGIGQERKRRKLGNSPTTSSQQLLGSLAGTNLPPEALREKQTSDQQIEADKFIHESSDRQRLPLLSTNGRLEAVPEVIPPEALREKQTSHQQIEADKFIHESSDRQRLPLLSTNGRREAVPEVIPPDALREKQTSHQQIEADKFIHERSDRQRLPLLSTNGGRQAVPEVTPMLDARMTTSNVEEEPVEFGELPSFDPGKSKFTENLSQPPKCKRAKPPSAKVPSKKTGQSARKNTKTETSTRGRQALTTSQVSAGLNEFVAKEASAPRGKPKFSGNSSNKNRAGSNLNTISREIGMSTVVSDALTSHMSRANAMGNVLGTSFSSSSIAIKPVLEDLDRLLKVITVHERHELHKRKHEASRTIEENPVYSLSLVASHLKDSENRSSTQNGAGPSHTYFLDGNRSLCKTRILTFVHIAYFFFQEAKKSLIIRERLGEGLIEASVVSEHETDIYEYPLQTQTFHNRRYAELYAIQFNKLMAREGYVLINDQIESVPIHTENRGISQQPTFPINTPAAGALEPPPPPPSSTEHCPAQFQHPGSTNSSSSSSYVRGPSSMYGNVQYDQQLYGQQLPAVGYMPNTQMGPMNHHWQQQQVVYGSPLAQRQMMQREKLRQHLAQRRMVMEGLGVATTNVVVRPRTGTARIGSFSNPIPMVSSIVPGIPNSGEISTASAVLGNAAVLSHESPEFSSRPPLS